MGDTLPGVARAARLSESHACRLTEEAPSTAQDTSRKPRRGHRGSVGWRRRMDPGGEVVVESCGDHGVQRGEGARGQSDRRRCRDPSRG